MMSNYSVCQISGVYLPATGYSAKELMLIMKLKMNSELITKKGYWILKKVGYPVQQVDYTNLNEKLSEPCQFLMTFFPNRLDKLRGGGGFGLSIEWGLSVCGIGALYPPVRT